LKVKADFWTDHHALIEPCPLGYCCDNPTDGCDWNASEACQGNRDRSYPLCGGCLPGFSQTIDGINCIQDEKCGKKSAAYITAQLLFWGLYSVYALHQARYPPLVRALPKALQPSLRNSGAISVLIYFFQLAMVAVPDGYSTLVGAAASAIGEFSRVQQLVSGSGSVCIVKGAKMMDRLIWRLLGPLGALMMLPLVMEILPLLISRCSKIRASRAMAASEAVDKPLIEPIEQPNGDTKDNSNDHNHGIRDDYEGGLLDHVPRCDTYADVRHSSYHLSGALACLLLFSFTDFSEGTLRLLNCVRIGDESVLVYAGANTCRMSWQFPFVLLLTILMLVPLVSVCLWLLRRVLPLSWRLSQWAHARRLPAHPILQAVKRHAVEPFADDQWHWTAVLCLQVGCPLLNPCVTLQLTHSVIYACVAPPERDVPVVGNAARVHFGRDDAGLALVPDIPGNLARTRYLPTPMLNVLIVLIHRRC
jgi:hypothetical protein